MNVNDVVAAKIAAARLRAESERKARAERKAARSKGLALRHAAKLRAQAARRPEPPGVATPEPEETDMSERTLTPGPLTVLADEIRDHGYAILQTRIERVARARRGILCQDPDGCTKPATLATFAVEEVVEEDNATGFVFAKAQDGMPAALVSCDEHRCEASHELYFTLTGQLRPDGIRAFDAPGQHLDWTVGGQP
jgi:hypothetical protein